MSNNVRSFNPPRALPAVPASHYAQLLARSPPAVPSDATRPYSPPVHRNVLPDAPAIFLPGQIQEDEVSTALKALKLKQDAAPSLSFQSDAEQVVPDVQIQVQPEEVPAFSIAVAPPSPKALKPTYVPKVIEPEDDIAPKPPEKATPSVELITTQSIANDLTCAGCLLPIAGKILSALERRWHPDCFKCAECGEGLEHVAFFEHDGKAYCHFDYHEKYSLRCHHCKTPIVDETYITLDDPTLGQRYYHDLHFFCSQCGDPFIDPKSLRKISDSISDQESQTIAKPFVVHDGWPYCETCNLNLHKPKCQACKKPIVDEVLKAMNQSWHQECFNCTRCLKPLEDQFLVRQDEPYCQECYRIVIRADF